MHKEHMMVINMPTEVSCFPEVFFLTKFTFTIDNIHTVTCISATKCITKYLACPTFNFESTQISPQLKFLYEK